MAKENRISNKREGVFKEKTNQAHGNGMVGTKHYKNYEYGYFLSSDSGENLRPDQENPFERSIQKRDDDVSSFQEDSASSRAPFEYKQSYAEEGENVIRRGQGLVVNKGVSRFKDNVLNENREAREFGMERGHRRVHPQSEHGPIFRKDRRITDQSYINRSQRHTRHRMGRVETRPRRDRNYRCAESERGYHRESPIGDYRYYRSDTSRPYETKRTSYRGYGQNRYVERSSRRYPWDTYKEDIRMTLEDREPGYLHFDKNYYEGDHYLDAFRQRNRRVDSLFYDYNFLDGSGNDSLENWYNQDTSGSKFELLRKFLTTEKLKEVLDELKLLLDSKTEEVEKLKTANNDIEKSLEREKSKVLKLKNMCRDRVLKERNVLLERIKVLTEKAKKYKACLETKGPKM